MAATMTDFQALQALRYGIVNPSPQSSGSTSSITLNSANTRVAWKFFCPKAGSISQVLIFQSAETGTPGNITMTGELFNELDTSTLDKPGTTQRAVKTGVASAGANKWASFTFTSPYAAALGEVLWFVVKNTAGAPATDFPSIKVANAFGWAVNNWASLNSPLGFGSHFLCYSSTDAFGTAGTNQPCSMIVVVFNDGSVHGMPFTTSTASPYTNNANERGLLLEGLTMTRQLLEVIWNPLATVTNVYVYEDANTPGGTRLYSQAVGTTANKLSEDVNLRCKIETPPTLRAGHTYRVVLKPSGSTQTPGSQDITDYASFTTIFDKFFGLGFTGVMTQESSGAWVDTYGKIPSVSLVLGPPIKPTVSSA